MSAPPRRLAVITGGHPFDVPRFHDLVRRITAPDLIADVQHLDEFASLPASALQVYDAAVFYCFPLTGPVDDGQAWHAGRPREAITRLVEAGTGLVVLHHALLAYPQWELWDDIVGSRGRDRFTYHGGQQLEVRVAPSGHVITQGLAGWSMVDETYGMPEPPASATPLLCTEHPLSMRTIAWAHHCAGSRVVCLQSGHDDQAWSCVGIQTLLARGLRWSMRGAGSGSADGQLVAAAVSTSP